MTCDSSWYEGSSWLAIAVETPCFLGFSCSTPTLIPTPNTTDTTPDGPTITTTPDDVITFTQITGSSDPPEIIKNCSETKGPTRRGTEKYGTELMLYCRKGCLSIHKVK